jgi:hypothetical protein
VSKAIFDGLSQVEHSGKSDPFASFTLNGQKVYKSETKKKTLAPVWNENFTVQIVCIHFILRNKADARPTIAVAGGRGLRCGDI